MIFVVTKKVGQQIFFYSFLLLLFLDPGSRIPVWDPRSEIWDGQKSGSGTRNTEIIVPYVVGTVPGCDVCLSICTTDPNPDDTLSSLCEGPAAQTACPHHRNRAAAVAAAAAAVVAAAVAAVAVVLATCQQLLPHAGQIAGGNRCSFAA